MPTRTIDLTEHYDNLIASGIESGQFSNASEAVREGLRLLEQHQSEDEAKIARLRDTTTEALASFDRGEGVPISSVEDIDVLVTSAIEERRAARRTTHA